MWQEGKRYVGVALPGEQKITESSSKCAELCASIEECNAATYTTTTKYCWPSVVADGVEEQAEYYEDSPNNDSIRLCEE